MFPVAVNDFRRALIRRFPYEIFYEIANDRRILYSVFYCSQHLEKWRKRLRSED